LGELVWWHRRIRALATWYNGLNEKAKVQHYNLTGNIAVSWAKAYPKYPTLMHIPPDYFEHMKILDIGCGPLPFALAFTNCEIYGIDPLLASYRRIGFPVDSYSKRLKYVSCPAEKMPFEDNFFDAIISFNAIDHVDDLAQVAQETSRVLRPGGIIRLWIEQHPPRILEPWLVDDETIIKYFGHLGIRKISETPTPGGNTNVVWGNRD
jgi:ubiquinone/menaquinone biosynthesis C-methylase UbiE